MRDSWLAAASAGLTAFLWYACGAVPLQLSVAGQLGLTPAQTSSRVFIVWASGALVSIWLSLRLKQPLPVTWTIPGLVYLGTLAGRFTLAEITGGLVVAAVLLVGLAAAGLGNRLMRWLPLPVVMGMFAGSLLEYLVRTVVATVDDALVAGSVVAGYIAARFLASMRIPPVGAALAAGSAALALTWDSTIGPLAWGLPSFTLPQLAFDPAAMLAVSVPLVVLAMGLGNVQGLGFVLAQGYVVPVDRVSRAVALASVANALFGGAPATVARNGAAILAAPDAGPARLRYRAVVIASSLTLVLACGALPLASLFGALPGSFIIALAGVALVSPLQDALEKSFSGPQRFGALVAFVVAAAPFTALGMPPSLWGLLAGVAVSFRTPRP